MKRRKVRVVLEFDPAVVDPEFYARFVEQGRKLAEVIMWVAAAGDRDLSISFEKKGGSYRETEERLKRG